MGLDVADAYNMRMGLTPYETDHTFEQIAEKYEVTRSAVYQALEKYTPPGQEPPETPPPAERIEDVEGELQTPQTGRKCPVCSGPLVDVDGQGLFYCRPCKQGYEDD